MGVDEDKPIIHEDKPIGYVEPIAEPTKRKIYDAQRYHFGCKFDGVANPINIITEGRWYECDKCEALFLYKGNPAPNQEIGDPEDKRIFIQKPGIKTKKDPKHAFNSRRRKTKW